MIQIDHSRFATSRAALAARAHDMGEQRRDVAVAVEALLAQWHGEAADRFREHWEDWRGGADTVIEALHAHTSSLASIQADLGHTDQESGDAHSRLVGRLG